MREEQDCVEGEVEMQCSYNRSLRQGPQVRGAGGSLDPPSPSKPTSNQVRTACWGGGVTWARVLSSLG